MYCPMAKKKKDIEEFLSAPDTIKRNKKERAKALQRKAQNEAYDERCKAMKRKTRPSREDLLNDLIRVAEDKETNPYYKFRSISPQRYRLYGHWPIEWLFEAYGQFAHALQVAGLRDQPGTRQKKAAISEASRRQHAARYIKRYIKPYVMKDPGLQRTMKGGELWLVISDTHSTFLDPFTWQVFLSAIRDLQPDGVYFNGDILECAGISKYLKIPGWQVDLQTEFDFARLMFEQVRRMGHEGYLIWGGGNHGIDRLARYLTQEAQEFSKLRSMRFDKLVELEGLDVTLAHGGTIASPKGEENDRMGVLLHGFYRIHHGTKLGKNPALAELEVAARSGTSGHCHRAMMAYGSTEAFQGMSWMSTPSACTELAARSYIKGATGWQRGFGVVHLLPGEKVHQYPVITDGGVAVVEGHIYEKLSGLRDQDPMKLWIKDFPLPKD
jgi:UDP-2,3-diacylglucosamine pyrophosphatase LpxH